MLIFPPPPPPPPSQLADTSTDIISLKQVCLTDRLDGQNRLRVLARGKKVFPAQDSLGDELSLVVDLVPRLWTFGYETAS